MACIVLICHRTDASRQYLGCRTFSVFFSPQFHATSTYYATCWRVSDQLDQQRERLLRVCSPRGGHVGLCGILLSGNNVHTQHLCLFVAIRETEGLKQTHGSIHNLRQSANGTLFIVLVHLPNISSFRFSAYHTFSSEEGVKSIQRPFTSG